MGKKVPVCQGFLFAHHTGAWLFVHWQGMMYPFWGIPNDGMDDRTWLIHCFDHVTRITWLTDISINKHVNPISTVQIAHMRNIFSHIYDNTNWNRSNPRGLTRFVLVVKNNESWLPVDFPSRQSNANLHIIPSHNRIFHYTAVYFPDKWIQPMYWIPMNPL